MSQQVRTLTECLAPLILRVGVPLRAVAAIGSIIELDARLLDYNGGLPGTFEELGVALEQYEVILRGARAAAQEFARGGDPIELVERLIKIKSDLDAFSLESGWTETRTQTP